MQGRRLGPIDRVPALRGEVVADDQEHEVIQIHRHRRDLFFGQQNDGPVGAEHEQGQDGAYTSGRQAERVSQIAPRIDDGCRFIFGRGGGRNIRPGHGSLQVRRLGFACE